MAAVSIRTPCNTGGPACSTVHLAEKRRTIVADVCIVLSVSVLVPVAKYASVRNACGQGHKKQGSACELRLSSGASVRELLLLPEPALPCSAQPHNDERI